MLTLLVPMLVATVFAKVARPLRFAFLFVTPILCLYRTILTKLVSTVAFTYKVDKSFDLKLVRGTSLG